MVAADLDHRRHTAMNQSHKVRTNRQRQTGSKTKTVKPGIPYRGANLVAQREESTKKNASRSASTRRAAKK
jgi:hypothetical protein